MTRLGCNLAIYNLLNFLFLLMNMKNRIRRRVYTSTGNLIFRYRGQFNNVSLTTLNTGYSYLIKNGSFKQYAIGLTCLLFYYIRFEALVRQFSKEAYDVNICRVKIHLVTRFKDWS